MSPARVFLVPLLAALLWCAPALAEQKATFGEYEVHYIVLPTTFLQGPIATQYDIPRGRDRALVNVSVLDAGGQAVKAQVSGSTRNLLGQAQVLDFREVSEGSAVYYLAVLRHANEEHHRIELNVTLPDGQVGEIRLQQQMFWES